MPEPSNHERAERASETISRHGAEGGFTGLSDLLTDLLHYAKVRGVSFTAAYARADAHFRAEVATEEQIKRENGPGAFPEERPCGCWPKDAFCPRCYPRKLVRTAIPREEGPKCGKCGQPVKQTGVANPRYGWAHVAGGYADPPNQAGDRCQQVVDVRVTDHGSLMLVLPLTDAARDWLTERDKWEETTYYGNALVVEPRAAVPILEGMEGAGLTLTFTGGTR